jgi:hypothetical protein
MIEPVSGMPALQFGEESLRVPESELVPISSSPCKMFSGTPGAHIPQVEYH